MTPAFKLYPKIWVLMDHGREQGVDHSMCILASERKLTNEELMATSLLDFEDEAIECGGDPYDYMDEAFKSGGLEWCETWLYPIPNKGGADARSEDAL